MKKFKDFIINEEVDLTATIEHGNIDVHDHAVRNTINSYLNGELARCFVTPYVGLERANKVLANFHIYLPKAPFMEDDHGVHVFRINQFNKVAGMRNDGSVVTKVENPYSLYFEWKRNEKGLYDIFAEVVTDDELNDLLKAISNDVSNAEEDREEKLDEAKQPKKEKKLGFFGAFKKMLGPSSGKDGNDPYETNLKETKKAAVKLIKNPAREGIIAASGNKEKLKKKV